MNNTTITFRTNKELKEHATEIFKRSGITLSDALNSFLSKVVENDNVYISGRFKEDFSYTYPKGFFDLFGIDDDPSMTFPDRLAESNDIEAL